MAPSEPAGASAGKCPNCGRPAEQAYRPFCSRRCADVDLSRWLRGGYAIPGEPAGERAETNAPAGEDAAIEDPGTEDTGSDDGKPARRRQPVR